jgi:hypothetical protein
MGREEWQHGGGEQDQVCYTDTLKGHNETQRKTLK